MSTTPPGLPDPTDHNLAWWNGEPALYAWWQWAQDQGYELGRVNDDHRVLGLYSEAVPTAAAVHRLAALGPIIEVGAGGGYWSRLIQDVGGDVIPTDPNPEHGWHGEVTPWTEVQRCDAATAVEQHPDRIVLSCWPPRPTGYMTQALEVTQHDTVALVTDGPNTMITEDPLYTRLESSWSLAERIELPRWPGRFDSLMVWRRR